MAPEWDPDQYERFKDERKQPFLDLLGLLRPHSGGRAIDLGCGTGELTGELHSYLDASETIGLDRSTAMLAKSTATEYDGLHFVRGDIAKVATGWAEAARRKRNGDPDPDPDPDPPEDGHNVGFSSGGRFGVVFSNAALQWLPDHSTLIADIVTGIVPGGQLAIQVPANFDHPSHTVADEIAAEEPFRSTLAASRTSMERVDWVLQPDQYAAVLHESGASDQHVRLQVYGHVLGSTLDVVEWVKGSLLTPYRTLFDDATFSKFVTRYSERLLEIEGMQKPYFYPFKRILMWAVF